MKWNLFSLELERRAISIWEGDEKHISPFLEPTLAFLIHPKNLLTHLPPASDMTVASPTATFGLPEALRGIYAGAGGLPRLVRNVGIPLASEISMTGRTLSAREALQYNLINKVSSSPETLIEEAVALASKVANISPDAIIVTRAALRETWETASVERGYILVDERFRRGLMEGENTKEGLAAFREKRKPVWKASKL